MCIFIFAVNLMNTIIEINYTFDFYSFMQGSFMLINTYFKQR